MKVTRVNVKETKRIGGIVGIANFGKEKIWKVG